jgi:ligand-binding sensor domain-containing protein/signal transduction histidine kinase
MFWVLAAALAAASAPVPAAPAQPTYTIDRWGVENGLPNNALSGLMQTRDGYLWISTWAGVVRFDGVRFEPVSLRLPNDHARSLLQDHTGAIWISATGAGLSRIRGGRTDTFTPREGLAGVDVRALVEDRRGRIWAGTEDGVSVVDGDTVRTFRADTHDRNTVNGLALGADDRIWVATSAGLCEAAGDRLQCDPAHAEAAHAVFEDRAGRVWVGTESGLSAINAPGVTRALCGGADCFAGETVTALAETRDGALLAGFDDGGIAIVRQDGIRRYGAADGLPTGGFVVAFYEDAEGSIWIATYNSGLGRLRPTRVRVYSTADGLPAKAIGSIVQDAHGTIWAGSQCGPVSELVGDRFVPRFQEYTKDACAWVVLPARDGSLWIGTRGRGLFRWHGGRMTHYGTGNGLSSDFVCALFEDRDGVVWIGTELGGLHTFAHERLSRAYGEQDGVATGYLASFAQDRDGRVWIGSNANGLTVYEHGRFRTLTSRESPPTKNIANLLVDSRGDLWVGSAAAGLFRRRDGRYEPFGADQGLGDRLIAVLIEDRDGTMWVSTAHGISRLTRDRIEEVASGRRASLDPIILDRTDGMLNTEGSGGGLDPSGLRDRDGRLWFSTIDGIVVVDPATFRINRIPPPVLVEGATADGTPLTRGADAFQVPAGATSVDIAYTAFSFLAPQRVRFRYRLDGFDRDWRDVGARRTAYYTRLPPGTYSFEVMAANNDGVWSRGPAVLQIEVLPLWWQRRAVQAAALVLLLAATGGAVRRFTLQRARSRLAVLERERALERERSRIARDLHDDLGARLSHIAILSGGAGASDRDARVAAAAREAVQTMDELVWAVNARNDTVESFVYYVAQFAEEHVIAAGLRCRLDLPPELPPRVLSADVRRHLYLAVKEAINNAVKHSFGTEVRVSVRLEPPSLVVEVADNGRGLPPELDPTGNGLQNLRERMSAAQGRLDVQTAPGRGTRMRFTIPL